MKIGDLVTLAWGEHPRGVGVIIRLIPGNYENVRVHWMSGETGNFLVRSLELVNENR